MCEWLVQALCPERHPKIGFECRVSVLMPCSELPASGVVAGALRLERDLHRQGMSRVDRS